MVGMDKEKNNNLLVLVLGGLLVVATFFVGRLSSQVELLKGKESVKGADVVKETGQLPAPDLSLAGLKDVAVGLDLDMNEFNRCLDEGDFEDLVKTDADLAESFGIGGTPTFVINGYVLVGAVPQEKFEVLIEAILRGEEDEYLEENPNMKEKVEIGLRGDNLRGEKGAEIEMVEFSDFECPFCTRAYPTVKALLEKYEGKLVFEYRHLPLGMHVNAQKVAEAVECAGSQGKFWEMHDALFEAGM